MTSPLAFPRPIAPTLTRPAPARRSARPARVPAWIRLVRDPAHGPLPALLLVLTVACGLVDGVTVVGLGGVFAASMAGDLVFGGVPLVAALAGFLTGSLAAGRLVGRSQSHRGVLLRNAVAIEAGLVWIAIVVLAVDPDGPSATAAVGVAALLGVAMGLQGTTARRLAVPGLPTTVVTMIRTTLGGRARPDRPGHGGRHPLVVPAVIAGALGGAVLAAVAGPAWALALPTLVLAWVAAFAWAASSRPARWQSDGVTRLVRLPG